MFLFHHQNAGQNHNVKLSNKSFEDVGNYRFVGMAVTNHD
jgi:hypothetical protein